MKKHSLLFIFFLLLSTVSHVFSLSDDISCSIRLYNKSIYYSGDNIELRVELYNNSPKNFSFQTADPKYFNTKTILKDTTGKELKDKYKFIKEINSFQSIYYRNMTIQPGELFAFNINLNEIVDITEAGIYFLQLEFFPGLSVDEKSIKSNIIDISIRPNVGVNALQKLIDHKTSEILKREKKAPDEVVKYTIEALQESEFEKYFLYIDLESIMLKSQDKMERFKRLSDIERKQLTEEYRMMLIKNMQADYKTAASDAIIYRPFFYKIIKTWYTDENAEVVVSEKFKYEQLTEIKDYTYKLKNIDGIWFIYDYIVFNKGTE